MTSNLVDWSRLATGNWDLPATKGNGTTSMTASVENIAAAHIIGIHQELKKLNALLHCRNFTLLPMRVAHIESMISKKVNPKPLRTKRRKPRPVKRKANA